MTPLMLTGQTTQHLIQYNEKCWLHPLAATAFEALKKSASNAGFTLEIVSGFRSFERQCAIWNSKFSGQRAILDHSSRPIDPGRLTEQQKVMAILRWSAMPGSSRHHWGTDIDIYDPTLQGEHPLELVPEEYSPTGPQAPLYAWLKENLHQHGFFFPYRHDRGGVSPEPWHISYAPVSTPCLSALTTQVLSEALQQHDVSAKAILLEQLPFIEQQFIRNIDSPES